MTTAWAGKKFWDSHQQSKVRERYDNVYEWFVRDVFYEKQAQWEAHKNTMFDEQIDYKQFLEDYFKIKL